MYPMHCHCVFFLFVSLASSFGCFGCFVTLILVEIDINHRQTERRGICSSVEQGCRIQGKTNHGSFSFLSYLHTVHYSIAVSMRLNKDGFDH